MLLLWNPLAHLVLLGKIKERRHLRMPLLLFKKLQSRPSRHIGIMCSIPIEQKSREMLDKSVFQCKC